MTHDFIDLRLFAQALLGFGSLYPSWPPLPTHTKSNSAFVAFKGDGRFALRAGFLTSRPVRSALFFAKNGKLNHQTGSEYGMTELHIARLLVSWGRNSRRLGITPARLDPPRRISERELRAVYDEETPLDSVGSSSVTA